MVTTNDSSLKSPGINSKHFLFSLLLLFSCTNKKVENNSATSATPDSAAPVQVTILANLPDTLQPETILIENTPAPKTFKIPDKPTTITINHKSGSRTLNISPMEKIKASFSPIMQNYTTEQGLAMDVMSTGFADKKGNLWFSTTVGGVSKYDGHSFTNYTTANGLIGNGHRITEDKAGNIWFASGAGVSKFDGTTFSTVGNFKDVSNLLEDSKGNFWFCTSNGLYKYTGDSITWYSESDGLSANRVNMVKEDPKGILWVGTDNGLFTYDTRLNDEVAHARPTESFGREKRFTNIALSKKDVSFICIDKRGNAWAATSSGIIKCDARLPDGQGTKITSYPTHKYSPFYIDRLDNIWFNGEEGGLSYFNANSPSIVNKFYNFKSGASAIEDKSGNLWFSGGSKGVFKYSGPAFQQLADGTDIRSIFEDKSGNIWFDLYGVTRFDGEYFTSFGFGSQIWCMFQDKSGIIWIGSVTNGGEGLIKLENNSLTFYNDLNGLVDNVIRFIAQDSKGNLWIGTDKGLSKFDARPDDPVGRGKSFTNFTTKQGLAGDMVSYIIEDKPGEFFLGTSNGLSYFDGKSFTNYSISHTPEGNNIRSLVKDTSGNLWMGTFGGGLTRYDGKSFYAITIDQGLPDNVVTQVTLTKEGNIAVGTNNGIALLTGFKSVSDEEPNNSNNSNTLSSNIKYSAQNSLSNSELKNFTPVFEIYNPKTGYPVMDVNQGQHAIFEDSKGILWIASGAIKSGLVRFDYSALFKNNNPPELNIVSVKVNDELVCWRNLLKIENNDKKPASRFESIAVPAFVTEEVTTFGKTLSDAQREEMRKKYEGVELDGISKFYPVPQNLKLPYSHNKLTIEFAAIEPGKPQLVQYQYMLEGYDKKWSTPANVTSATFGNMYEGTYHFNLKARSPSGIWSEPLTYTFTVLPPWWRTWYARFAFVLMAVSLLYAMYRYRIAQIMRMQRMRNRISRDLHDQVGSTLGSIAQFSQLAKRSTQDPKITELLDRIDSSSRKSVETMSDIVWAINPNNDRFDKLISRITDYAHEILHAKDIRCTIDVDERIDGLAKLNVDQRKNIFLILKEAIYNAAKYSHCSLVNLSVKRSGKLLQFKIEDNGDGFDLNAVSSYNGNGLRNIKQRAEELKAPLKIESAPGAGTKILLDVEVS